MESGSSGAAALTLRGVIHKPMRWWWRLGFASRHHRNMWDTVRDLVLGTSCLECQRPGRLWCQACWSQLPTQAMQWRDPQSVAGLPPVFTAGLYRGALRAAIGAHKEQRAFSLTPLLAALLAVSLRAWTSSHHASQLVLVPIPSRAGTVRKRGHDAMRRVVRQAAARLRAEGMWVATAPLLRVHGPVRDQAGLSARARRANIAGAMRVRPAWQRALAQQGHYHRIVLCDDVITSGATLREAVRALGVQGINAVGVATVAATPAPGSINRSGTRLLKPPV